jgi:hypothetical protein
MVAADRQYGIKLKREGFGAIVYKKKKYIKINKLTRIELTRKLCLVR